MKINIIEDKVIKNHVEKILRDQMSSSTSTGEVLLGAEIGQGHNLRPLLAINMYVSALFTIIKLLKYIDENK